MPRQASYYEKQGTSFLFTKRLNPAKGTYPLFQERVKRKLAATNEAEARIEALRHSAELDFLQQVCLKDSKSLPASLKDYSKAAKAWLWVSDADLDQLTRQAKGHTNAAMEAKEFLDLLRHEVIDHFRQTDAPRGGSDEYREWLTAFGDYLLSLLNEGGGQTLFSEVVPIYLKHTNRDHLPPTHKAVHDAARYVSQYVQIAGDKPVDQISRRDVDAYIERRLLEVKTTSVEREISSLRAIWGKVSKVLDVRTQNPFSDPTIKGLGRDAVKRAVPTLGETRKLLTLLEGAKPSIQSYVVPLIAVAALTGLRLSEAWGLQESDWNTEGETLLVQPNERRSNLKTANSARPLPVLPELASWLELFFSQRPATSANSASASTLKWLKQRGFEFGNHSLRHGFKQRLTEIDVPLAITEELQGWSRQTMADRYGYVSVTNEKRRVMRVLYDHMLDLPAGANVVSLHTAPRRWG